MSKIKRATLTKINSCDCGNEELVLCLIQSNLWQLRCKKCHALICYMGCAEVAKLEIAKKIEISQGSFVNYISNLQAGSEDQRG